MKVIITRENGDYCFPVVILQDGRRVEWMDYDPAFGFEGACREWAKANDAHDIEFVKGW